MGNRMVRVQLTLPKALLKEYDEVLQKRHLNRSEHFREIIRTLIASYHWQKLLFAEKAPKKKEGE